MKNVKRKARIAPATAAPTMPPARARVLNPSPKDFTAGTVEFLGGAGVVG